MSPMYFILGYVVLIAWTIIGTILWSDVKNSFLLAYQKKKYLRCFLVVLFCGPIVMTINFVTLLCLFSLTTMRWILQETGETGETDE